MARLDGIIGRLDNAERKALQDLRDEGFPVHTIHQARVIQAEYREAARIHASAVERMSVIAQGRRTA
jgi:hypothetical protein